MRKSIIRQIIAKNIRHYRKKCGFSQEKLAALTDLHSSYISRVELGKVNISADTLEKIANALDVETYILLKPKK